MIEAGSRVEAEAGLPAVTTIDPAEAEAIIARAIARYVAERRDRIKGFVDANFSLLGALRLHREALGLDLVRAPANLALVPPYLVMQLGAAGLGGAGARRAARWLRTRNLFLTTDVARELTFRLHRDLLELPYGDGARRTEHNALAEAILADQRLALPLAAIRERLQQRGEPEAGARLLAMLETYAGARTAAADLFNNALLASTGAALFQKLTPGAFSLGPVLAGAIAHQAAVASFPLGAGLGSLWYAWFPTAPSAALLLGTTGGLMLLTAVTAGFAGVVSDPVQRALGLHARRLERLIDALARELAGDSDVAFQVRDHYVARIFDLVDLSRAAARALSG
ncbi:MAG TPA: DUF6635 family protein [Geminicoccaceae bacterium]|nr:DUF6635 family protein [Geminicoccaceae bacterium]